MTRYYAILDPAGTGTARNVFIVDDSEPPVAMVYFRRSVGRWEQDRELIEYLAGPREAEAAEIGYDVAAGLVAAWGTRLPDAAELRALARGGA